MNGASVMFATVTGILVLAGPALLFLGLTFLSDAPGEWGRGALTAWLALTSVLIAGLAVGVLGPWLVLGVLVLALVAIITGGGGITGLAIAALLALGLAVGQFTLGAYPLHIALAPALAAIGVVAVLRQFFF
ncbi:MAG: hypothetical protein AAFY59_04390 [Pseudomonadota bacterium]